MKKREHMQRIEACGVIAIIRTNNAAELIKVTDAIKTGGVDIIEITMTTPNAISIITGVAANYGSEILVGVGSVLDAETARTAMLAGAEFVVSPVTKPDIIEMCNRYGTVVMSGAFTPTEILKAWEIGADYVKVFPSSGVGPGYIKDIKAPMPQIPLVPTGGVNLNNAGEFIRAGAAALGVGSALVNNKVVAEGQYNLLTSKARRLVEAVQIAKTESTNMSGS